MLYKVCNVQLIRWKNIIHDHGSTDHLRVFIFFTQSKKHFFYEATIRLVFSDFFVAFSLQHCCYTPDAPWQPFPALGRPFDVRDLVLFYFENVSNLHPRTKACLCDFHHLCSVPFRTRQSLSGTPFNALKLSLLGRQQPRPFIINVCWNYFYDRRQILQKHVIGFMRYLVQCTKCIETCCILLHKGHIHRQNFGRPLFSYSLVVTPV